jgi:hypothetical protein
MKTFFLMLICGLSTLIVFPQSYHKLIRTNVHWDGYNVVEPEFFCYTSAERIYFTNQDTAINGRNYRISKFQNIITLNPYGYFCPPLAVEPTAFNTDQFMREDTISKKVYIYTPDMYGGKDQLFYDFTLNPGDTLQSSYYYEIYILDSIGTFYLNDGESRKIFWFHANYPVYSAYYIESIGNAQGLFAPLTQFIESYSGYLCVEENSINLLGDVCENYYVGLNEKKGGGLTIYPNPSFDFINIDIPEQYDGSVMTIFNFQGVQIKSITLINGRNSISVSNVIPGIYIYHIQSRNGLVHGKITIL